MVITLCCVGTVPMFAATEDVWVLWFRTPDGTYNILSAGPTREECMAVLYKLLPGAAPGESLRSRQVVCKRDQAATFALPRFSRTPSTNTTPSPTSGRHSGASSRRKR